MQKLYLDIETNGTDGTSGDLLVVGAALEDGDVYVADSVHGVIKRFLADPNIATVSHSTFDARFLREMGYEVNGPLLDTKVMPWVVNENTPLDLDWLAHRYAGIDMDKRLRRSGGRIYFEDDDGRQYDLADWRGWKYTNVFALPGEPNYGEVSEVWRRFRAYNVRDVEALRDLYRALKFRLDESEWTPYWAAEEVPYTKVLLDMELRGMPIDLDAVAELTPKMETEAERLKGELLAEAGLPESFNLNSQKQLVTYLFSRQATLTDSLHLGADATACIKSCVEGEHEDCDTVENRADEEPERLLLGNGALHMVDLLPEGFVIDHIGREQVHGHWSVKGRGLRPTPKPINKVTGKEGELPSTSSPELLYMHASDEWVRKLCTQYRKTEKLLTTYLRKFPVIARDGRIYGSYHQTGTVTGRLSSSGPNMQNMPSRGEKGKLMRSLFVGNLIIADYDQLEMRIMAHLSGDPVLTKVFRDGRDPHSMLAEAIFGSVEVYDIAPGASASYRDAAKQLNYAMGYGAGRRKVAQTLSLMGFPTSPETAQGYLSEMARFYRVLFRWTEQTKANARRKGYVTTLGGRKRRLKGAFKDTANWKAVGYGERQAVNARVQGTAADIIRRAMIALDREVPYVPMLAQVHDELIFENDGSVGPVTLLRIKQIGETAHGFDLDVPLLFDPVVAHSWADKGGGHEVSELLMEDMEEE